MQDDTLLPKTPTSLGSWILLVVQAIDSYGLDSAAIFSQAGIRLEDVKKPHARIPTTLMTKVWELAVIESKDPYIALNVAAQFKPTVFSALGMSLAASRHAYDAIKRAAKYSQIISDGSLTELEETETELNFLLKPRPPLTIPVNKFGIESIFGSMHTVFKSIAGDDFHAKAVIFQHEFHGDITPYEDFFNCPVTFGGRANQIVFNKENLFQEQAFSNSTLTSTLDQWIEDHLFSFKEELLATKVKRYILKNIASQAVDQSTIAKELAVSPRVLQRRLKEEGTSYSELLDDCRHILAIKLISQDKLPLSEITYMLGFSDQSNFSRAFKRWTSVTPNHYKDN